MTGAAEGTAVPALSSVQNIDSVCFNDVGPSPRQISSFLLGGLFFFTDPLFQGLDSDPSFPERYQRSIADTSPCVRSSIQPGLGGQFVAPHVDPSAIDPELWVSQSFGRPVCLHMAIQSWNEYHMERWERFLTINTGLWSSRGGAWAQFSPWCDSWWALCWLLVVSYRSTTGITFWPSSLGLISRSLLAEQSCNSSVRMERLKHARSQLLEAWLDLTRPKNRTWLLWWHVYDEVKHPFTQPPTHPVLWLCLTIKTNNQWSTSQETSSTPRSPESAWVRAPKQTFTAPAGC